MKFASVLVTATTICSCQAFTPTMPSTTIATSTSGHRQHVRRHFKSSSSSQQLYSAPPQSDAEKEVQRLREQAAKIRAELAALEGKSIAQVEEEAAKEKEMARQRMEDLKKEREEKELSSSSSSSAKRKRLNSAMLYVPTTIEEQTRQAALAIERAFQDGITRQTVRLALVNEDSPIGPEEEEWPGGAKQMYREAGRPLTEALVSEVRATAKDIQTKEERMSGKEGLPPSIKAQDIWDFDGSALITAEAAQGPSGDVQALVFPNTDVKYLNDIAEIDTSLGKKRLFLLVNPFWRNVESWGFNILAPNAKKKAQATVFDCEGGGFEETYVLSRFSARGEDCVALKAYPNDWELFAYLEEYDYGIPTLTTVRLGSSKEEPKSSTFTELLNEREEFKLNKTMRQLNRMK